MAEWFYIAEGQATGPMDETGLREMFQNGLLPRDTHVWQQGMENWAPASDLAAFSTPALPGDHILTPVVPQAWNPASAASVARSVANTPVSIVASKQNQAPAKTPVAREPKTSASAHAKAPAAKVPNDSEVIFRTPYRFSFLYAVLIVALTVVWWFITADFLHSTKILIIDGFPISHEGGSAFFIVMFVMLVIIAFAAGLSSLSWGVELLP